MTSGLAIALWVLGSATAGTGPQSTCALDVQAAATAYRLSELPQDISGDLTLLAESFGDRIADSDAPLLQTDAPTAAERGHPTVRFAQAMLVRDKWFVQLEVSQFAGVRTVAYVRQPDGRFSRSPSQYFGGPSCASIKAALAGVTTPGGF